MTTLLFDIGQYLEITKKFFYIKNFNINKIYHSKFKEKIAFRKPLFQWWITTFSIILFSQDFSESSLPGIVLLKNSIGIPLGPQALKVGSRCDCLTYFFIAYILINFLFFNTSQQF